MNQKPYKLSPTSGPMAPEKIVGRVNEIKNLAKHLESQSVVIEEFRRMGKTLLLKKYAYISSENQHVIYFTFQGVSSPGELIDKLLKELRKEQSFTASRIAFDGLKKILNKIKPEEVDLKAVSFKLPEWQDQWKNVLSTCLKDISQRKEAADETLILIFDELPIMLWDWINNGKAGEAMQLLDVLRSNNQTLEEGRVRFVICGSIGMQIVLNKLKTEYSYTGEPFNDAEVFSIGSMTHEDSYMLCECLILDDYEVGKDKEVLINKIIDYTNGLPFYINKVFTILRNEFDSHLSKQSITDAYNTLINEPVYSKALKQIDDRINIYYPEAKASIMKSILNHLSKEDNELEEGEILKKFEESESFFVQECLFTLNSEHYLKKEFKKEKRYYKFKYSLIKEWWRKNKA